MLLARKALLLGLFAGLYVVAGKLGLRLAAIHPSASPIWPASGVGLAAILLLGRSAAAAVWVGALLVNWTTYGTVWTSLGIASGNALEALLGGVLVDRFARGTGAFDRPRRVFRFAFFGGVLATLASPLVGIASLGAAGLLGSPALPAFFTWWLGDMGGVLVVAPAVVLWGRGASLQPLRARAAEAVAWIASLLAVGLGVLAGPVPHPVAFVCLPLTLWAAFRFTEREAATAVVVLGAVAVAVTAQGRGPFALPDANASLLLLQAFLSLLTLTSLVVAATVREGRQEAEARAATESSLRDRAVELARSNRDLEQFAYLASHDLQEPLRSIARYIELLADRYGERLDAEGHEFVRYAVDGAARLKQMIDAVLEFSRIGRADQAPSVVSLEEALARAMGSLSRPIEESKAVITHGPLPRIAGHEDQLSLVFQNLLANSIKFRGSTPPVVTVRATREGAAWTVRVCDNGIGFDPAHADNLFRLFHRLHGRSEYPGSGIGLALCRRIVEAHGGSIRAEGVPGGGATFVLMLPALPELDPLLAFERPSP